MTLGRSDANSIAWSMVGPGNPNNMPNAGLASELGGSELSQASFTQTMFSGGGYVGANADRPRTVFQIGTPPH